MIKGEHLSIDDILIKANGGFNFDLITSGAIPPNPGELLMSQRIRDLFTELRSRYEYIIVDTAPVGMVTDTLQIARVFRSFDLCF